MTIQALINELLTRDQEQFLGTFTMVHDAEIVFSWNTAGQTLGEFVTELQGQDLNATVTVDIEAGFVVIFREVQGVTDRYWSPGETVIDFITN